MHAAALVIARRAALGIVVALLSSGAWSAEPAPAASPAQAAPSKEMRERMATLHEQMAACLRSDTSFADCREQMRKGCRQTLGAQGCPFMGMGMGRGMPRGPMMQGPPAAPPQ